MKVNKVILCVLFIFLLGAVSLEPVEAFDSGSDSLLINKESGSEYFDSFSDYEIIVDTETGVEYFVFYNKNTLYGRANNTTLTVVPRVMEVENSAN